MSFQLMADVFDHAPYKDGTLVVLMALASWAGEDGDHIFPKIETIANKARRSVRSTQYAIRQLESDGVLITVSEGTGRRTTEYRFNMRVVHSWTQDIGGENKGCKICTHDEERDILYPDDGEGCKDCTPEVQPAAPQGCNACTSEVQNAASYIDKPVSEPVMEPVTETRGAAKRPPRQSERQKSRDRKAATSGPSPTDDHPSAAGHPLMAAWPEIWAAYAAVPGWNATMSETRAKAALHTLICEKADLPEPDVMIAAIGAFARDVGAENTRRRDPQFIPHLHSWLKERRWQAYLSAIRAGQGQAKDLEAMARQAAVGLGEAGFGKLVAAGLSYSDIAAWFGGASGEERTEINPGEGPTPVIYAASVFKAREIEKRFLAKLRGDAAFGPRAIVSVRAKTEKGE